MKALRLFVLWVVSTFCVFVQAEQSEKITIYNGYFFKEWPSSIKNNYSTDTQFFAVQTPDGMRALCIYSPSTTLSEELLQYAIPVDSINEGAELLRRYNDQKDNAFRVDDTKNIIKIGDEFPSFSVTDIDGKTWTNADVEGKVMVLNIWFTGCGPCRAEMPELSTWKDEMSDVMFFSSTYEAPEVARQVLDKVRFTWIPIVNDTRFKKWIGSKGYPLTIIVDKLGKIAAFEYGTSPEKRAALKNKIVSLK